MRTFVRMKLGWKLFALLCATLYAKPFALAFLYPQKVGWLLVAAAVIGVAWLVSLFSYAFNFHLLPKLAWRVVAVPSTVVTAYSLSSFLGYRATRLVVIDLDSWGIARTFLEMSLGTAFALATLVPLFRLAGIRLRGGVPRKRRAPLPDG